MISTRRGILSCGVFALASLCNAASAQQSGWVSANEIALADTYLCEHRLTVLPTNIPGSGQEPSRKFNLIAHNGARELRAPLSAAQAGEFIQFAVVPPGPRAGSGDIFVRPKSQGTGFEVGLRTDTILRIITPRPGYIFSLEKNCPVTGQPSGAGGVVGAARLEHQGMQLTGSFAVPRVSQPGTPGGGGLNGYTVERVVVISPGHAWGVSVRPGETVDGVTFPQDSSQPVTLSKYFSSCFGFCSRPVSVTFLGTPMFGTGGQEVVASGIFDARTPPRRLGIEVTGSGGYTTELIGARAVVPFSIGVNDTTTNFGILLSATAVPSGAVSSCTLTRDPSNKWSGPCTSAGGGMTGNVSISIEPGQQNVSGLFIFPIQCRTLNCEGEVQHKAILTVQPVMQGPPGTGDEFAPVTATIDVPRVQ